MIKRTMLTGFGVLLIMPCIAMAETFPEDEYMLENKTYDGAATYDNLGVYEDTVTAQAEYENILYNVSAGNYMAAGTVTETPCAAGNYCLGLTNITYNETQDQGLTPCPDGYPNSAVGSSANTSCYTACTLAVANKEHATAVTGNDYYGDVQDTCAATACEQGWHVAAGIPELIGDANGINRSSLSYNGGSSIYNEGLSKKWLNGNTSYAVDYGDNGLITGKARCADSGGDGYPYSSPTLRYELEADYSTANGKYCWCLVDGYVPAGKTTKKELTSAWVYSSGASSDANNCKSNCAQYCAEYMASTDAGRLAYRAAVLGSIGADAFASCETNIINITWTDATEEAIAATNAGTCEYTGDIRTPQSAVSKIGKRFVGWKFVKPSQN